MLFCLKARPAQWPLPPSALLPAHPATVWGIPTPDGIGDLFVVGSLGGFSPVIASFIFTFATT